MEDVIFYGNAYLYDLLVSRIFSFPPYIVVSLFVLLFCTIAVIELSFYILLGRIIEHYQIKKDFNLKNRIINMLANILVFGDNSDDTSAIVSHFLPRFLKLPLYRKSVRKILVAELLKNNSSFSGRTSEVIRELYLRLNLTQFAQKNLKSRHWNKQIEAIRELAQMDVKDQCANIFEYTNHHNPQLRIEAQIAYAKLCSENPFKFFDHVKETILDWHQIILFDIITKTETMSRPRFSFWLNSKNDSVVAFCLKLIEHYQQFDALPNLIYLINHYNIKIRASAIEILGRMEAEIAESHLIAAYPYQPIFIKIKMLNAIGLIASGASLFFLDTQARIKDQYVKNAAIRAIKAHTSRNSELLSTLFSEGFTPDKTVKYALDERMKI